MKKIEKIKIVESNVPSLPWIQHRTYEDSTNLKSEYTLNNTVKYVYKHLQKDLSHF